ncbi:MAG: hypothetical protein PHQ23_13250 [Candidatus Wallbacteria bacterium]|nr:hypothetical protein [Candidatus Wallbacteria bacterium]
MRVKRQFQSALLVLALIYSSVAPLYSQSNTTNSRLQVILEDKDFQFLQQIADVYKVLPDDIKEKLQPVLLQIKSALEKAAAAGIMKKEDIDKIIAMFGSTRDAGFDQMLAKTADECKNNLEIINEAISKALAQGDSLGGDMWEKMKEFLPDKKVPACPAIMSDKIYLIYTSGATSKPMLRCLVHGHEVELATPNNQGRIQVVFDEQDFSKIQILADIYKKLPADAKEKLKPVLEFAKAALLKAVDAGVLKKEDVDKIIAMFQENQTPDNTDRLQIIMEQKDFDLLQKLASLYTLIPDSAKEDIKPYLLKAKEILTKAAAAGIMKQEDVDKILAMFNLKGNGDMHPVAAWMTDLINRIVAIAGLQIELSGRGDISEEQVTALVTEAEQCTEEMIQRLQILLEDKDFEALQKAAAVYTLLPNDIKEQIKPVMEQVKQALLSAAKAGVLKQEDVDKILKMFNL